MDAMRWSTGIHMADYQVNAVTETFFERALKQAQKLDDHMEATGKPIGPLQ